MQPVSTPPSAKPLVTGSFIRYTTPQTGSWKPSELKWTQSREGNSRGNRVEGAACTPPALRKTKKTTTKEIDLLRMLQNLLRGQFRGRANALAVIHSELIQ